MSTYMPSRRVLRPRNMDGNRALVASMRAKPLRLPLDVLLLILFAVDSKATLLSLCCLCRGFQEEAERILYRHVTLRTVPQVRKFQRALKKAPRRALFVCYLSVLDNGYIKLAIPSLNEILPKFSKLTHLRLDAPRLYLRRTVYAPVLPTLNTCSFKLKSLELHRLVCNKDLLTFLTLQTEITFLDLNIDLPSDKNEVALAQDALPCVKYLVINNSFFLTHLRCLRSITHLNITFWSSMENHMRKVLDIVGDQLVSLRCHVTFLPEEDILLAPPTFPFKIATLPRLRYFELVELMSRFASWFRPDDDALAPMTRSNIVLETFVWHLEPGIGEVWHHVPQDEFIRHADKATQALLQVCPTLQQVICTYMGREPFAVRFTLSALGELVVDRRPAIRLTSRDWQDV